MIPFLDLRRAHAEIQAELDEALVRVARSGCYLLGPELEAFEADWARYCEARHAVGVSNGLDALVLALRALGVGPGDDVIVPANTFIATWLAVSMVGARPVPVEPLAGIWNLDPERVESAITPRTRAIVPVHLYGQPADLEEILAIARARGLAVIEDAAQCHGARYGGRRIGGHSDAVCWSFYPGKNLGALGDGGAVTTDRDDVADRIRMLRNYGSRVKYHHEIQGHNARLDEVQAAVLRVKLARLDAWNERRRRVARAYLDGLRDVRDLELPVVRSGREHVWHLFVVDHPRRDALQAHLSERGVATLIHYPVPPHRSAAYADMNLGEGSFPLTERAAKTHLSLPMGPHLEAGDVEVVIDAVRAFGRC